MKTPEVGKEYKYINGSGISWLKPAMLGTVVSIEDPYTAGVGHFDDDKIVIVEFLVAEKKPMLKGSSVVGYEEIEVSRRVSFAYSAFENDFI